MKKAEKPTREELLAVVRALPTPTGGGERGDEQMAYLAALMSTCGFLCLCGAIAITNLSGQVYMAVLSAICWFVAGWSCASCGD